MNRSEWITAVIVDDEPLGRKRVRQLLAEHADFHIVAEAATAQRAEQVLMSERPDVVFLDIQLPDGDTLDLLAKMNERFHGHTVFVTAHTGHALRAFDARAIDYLVKPLERKRFARAIGRIREIHLLERHGADSGPDSARLTMRPQRLAITSTDGRVMLIPVSRIDWIQADGNYIRLQAGEMHQIFRDTLTSLESRLDPAQFVRVHRSAIINVDRIRHLEPNAYGDYIVTLDDDTHVPLSRRYRERIALLLGQL
jgi:two-component system LytT family response regulator